MTDYASHRTDYTDIATTVTATTRSSEFKARGNGQLYMKYESVM